MESKKILNHHDLLCHISKLKDDKIYQEAELKVKLNEFAKTLDPLSIVKHSIHELTQNKEVRLDVAKVGLNVGANFLINTVLGRDKSIKGFLSSLLIKKISSIVIDKNASGIISGIGNFINKKS